jgi:hypothetical protein
MRKAVPELRELVYIKTSARRTDEEEEKKTEINIFWALRSHRSSVKHVAQANVLEINDLGSAGPLIQAIRTLSTVNGSLAPR